MPPRFAIILIVVAVAATVFGQQRIETGSFKGFVREDPMLMLTEIPEPFRVPEIKGVLYYGEDSPLADAFFEIRDSSGRITTTTTNKNGAFSIPSVKPGIYEFKATMNQFHSTIGKVIVSPRAPRKNVVRLQMHIGT
jgi:Carboxypeptidase regulatory-like domain